MNDTQHKAVLMRIEELKNEQENQEYWIKQGLKEISKHLKKLEAIEAELKELEV